MSKEIKKHHVFTKTVFQICLYSLEIGVFCGGATFVSIMLFDTNNTITTIEIMERFALFYGFYQLIVFLILTNLNDIQADEYLALKNTAELASLSLNWSSKLDYWSISSWKAMFLTILMSEKAIRIL